MQQLQFIILNCAMKSSFRKSEKDIMLDPAFSIIENRPEWRQFWKKEWYRTIEKGMAEIEYNVSAGNTRRSKTSFIRTVRKVSWQQ